MAFERLKYKLLFKRRIIQQKELARMSKINNATLHIFLESFRAVRNKKFTSSNLKAFKNVNNFKENILKDDSVISYDIFGSNDTNTVRNICKIAASTEKWGQLLHLISKKIEKPKILEIGTNLGISGSYILEAIADKKDGYFITMEGVEKLCEIASDNFKTIVNKNTFEVIQGLYENTFPKLLTKDINFNLLFIDGNHSKKPTIEYFEALKTKVELPTIFIFDDIHWSDGMLEAWNFIKNDPIVSFSIDIYKWGIVIIDNNSEYKNHNFILHPLSL